MKYEINTDAAQEEAITKEMKVVNGQRVANVQDEITREQFVAEFFKNTLHPFVEKWKGQDVTKIMVELQNDPTLVAPLKAALAAAKAEKAATVQG